MKKTSAHRQAGIFLVIFSLTVPVLLGLLVLAIDCGALYFARLRLTKVARVATGTGLNVLALRGWGAMVADPEDAPPVGPDLGLKTANWPETGNSPRQTVGNTLLLTEMHQSTLSALKTYYPKDFESLAPGASPTHLLYRDRTGATSRTLPLSALDATDSSIGLTIRYAIRTYLLGSLSNVIGTSGLCGDGGDEASHRCWVESVPTPNTKTGRLRPANVMMLLDVSGSMAGPKINYLIEAASQFIDMFNPRHDRFAFIPYATTADTGQAPTLSNLVDTTGAGVPDWLPIKQTIRNYQGQAGGQTNHCDALIQAIRTLEDPANEALRDKNTPKFVVLFTDGAPNVYRLNFCEDSSCSTTPPLLQTALNSVPTDPEATSPGWYGWTVKWDKREVFRRVPPHDTCPIDGSGGGETAPTPPGTGIPECDPVWAFPKVIAGSPGPELTYAEVSAHLRLHETSGEFYFKGGSRDGQTLRQLGYTLKFRNWGSMEAAYQVPDAFRWHGPSYLVHSSFRIPRGFSLIDRIPQELFIPREVTGRDPPITCGPGSLPGLPGSLTQTAPQVADKYNHSRYFSSRVVDANWRWNGSPMNDSEDKADKTGLTQNQIRNAPPYFEQPHTLQGNPHDSPGCLNTLRSKVPFTNAQIDVGDNFVSNASSTLTRGEAVKTAELPYYCALRAADWLRSEYNVVVFVVGLGTAASSRYDMRHGAACEDPLQNPLDPDSRKDNFLSRLAFAPESLLDPKVIFQGPSANPSWATASDFGFRNRTLSNCTTNHPLAGQTIEVGYSEAPITPNFSGYSPSGHGFTSDHLGAYFATGDPEELKIIFGEIAKRVLLRLAT